MKISKMIGFLSLLAMLFTSNLSVAKERSVGTSLKQAHPASVVSDKRCEKCKRGADGKMECEPIPCPK